MKLVATHAEREAILRAKNQPRCCYSKKVTRAIKSPRRRDGTILPADNIRVVSYVIWCTANFAAAPRIRASGYS